MKKMELRIENNKLVEQLEKKAARNHRSRNAEINAALEWWIYKYAEVKA